MDNKNLTTGGLDHCTQYGPGDKAYREYPLIEVELDSGVHKVRVLSEYEAKAKICEEYGFAYGAISIEATCWYEATDMNYFKFSVGGRWVYEAKDYGPLELLDYYDSRPYRNFHVSLGRKPPYFKDGLPDTIKAQKIGVLTAWPFSGEKPGEVWETDDGGKAVVFPDGSAALICAEDFVDLAVQVKKN